MLDNQKYEDFFSTFLSFSEYKKLQQYSIWWGHLSYWNKHEDKERGKRNCEEIEKNLPSMRMPLEGLFQAQKRLKQGQGIIGTVFHQLAVKEFQALMGLAPLMIIKPTYSFAYSMSDYKVLIALLLSININPNELDNYFKQTSLCAAIGFDNIPFALALLEFPDVVDVNQPCSNAFQSTSPLILSIQRGQVQVATQLIKRVDVNQADSNGLTALHWAMIMGEDVVLALLLAHSDIQLQQANNGKYPLDYEVIEKDAFSFCYNQYGHFMTNRTKAPEFRPILAHFWNNREAFLEYRESCQHKIQKCSELLREWAPRASIKL